MHVRTNYGEFGGPENLILHILENLDPSQFQFTVVSLKNQNACTNLFELKLKDAGVNTEIIPWKNLYFSKPVINRLNFLTQQNGINIIHTHDLRSNYVSFFAGKKAGIPTIASSHGWVGNSLKRKIHNSVDKISLRLFNKVIINSEFMKNQIPLWGIPKDRINIIHNAVALEHFNNNEETASLKKKLGIDSNKTVIATVGRLSREKGHMLLLEAASKVIAQLPDLIFLIIGEGPFEKKLKDHAKKLGLSKYVLFTGFFDDLPSVLNLTDIFILPSTSEGMPMTLLEAMSASKPIIATSVGGVPEVVQDGKTGILLKTRNPTQMAKAITNLVNNKKAAVEMGRKGRQLVEKTYSIEYLVKNIEDIYRSVVI